MLRFHNILPALAFVAVTGTALSANAGPCSAQIAQVEQQIGAAGANSEIGPSGPQTLEAQLGHQPTPQTVRDAEMTANALAQAALERVKKANSADNAAACTQALSAERKVRLSISIEQSRVRMISYAPGQRHRWISMGALQ